MTMNRQFHSTVLAQLAKVSRKELQKNAPKKPATVYSLFIKNNFALLKQQNPEAGFAEVSKLANARWKGLTDLQKKPYYDEAARLKREYEAVKSDFQKTLPPKRPASGYILYSNEVRPLVTARNPGLKPTELVKLISEQWKSLPLFEKDKYNAVYQKNMDQWKAVNGLK
ncbi:DNA-binding protein ABF2 Ecym_5207 [Eremothecium cymbalariae DBVPG|uniref:HMG box domain-containing protein n=1 Tax=Eremothecium cymbalariae (strain CBS 270.75 / DBVPG 7215 / KCTC 17166 / NRRL Y-17582) TaxID=931890 RepID=I6ND34_ERECY|nr:hypothetical protein Ecym_5207 [Eremothecium cymbalariae DBVPG\